LEAKDAGLVSFICRHSHHNPKVRFHAITSWPVDTVLIPVNPAESVLGGFLDWVLNAAKDRGLAVIGMKVLGASNYIFRRTG